MKGIRIPDDFVPADRFEKESSHWLEWVETSGRPVVVTRRGRAVAVLVAPDDYFGMSESVGVLQGLAAAMQRGKPSPGTRQSPRPKPARTRKVARGSRGAR